MLNIYGLTRKQLEDYFESIGEKKFKAQQVFEWLYQKKESDFDKFSNIKKDVIEKLKNDFTNNKIKIIRKQSSTDTYKYLFELEDKNYIEAVVMVHNYGNSICVSSQVGCNMGCAFCESGRLKKVRNLETYEIVEQILLIEEDLNIRLSSVVVMGIGEPFDNYDNIINFLYIINDAKGLAIGSRHITVSTSGLVPKILEFANIPLQINLAVSLHAPYDELRSKLMPVNKAYNIDTLMNAIKEYYSKTNRRVTIEYVMLKGVNDSESDAIKLAKLLKGMNVYVNLIPYNETNHIEFKKSNKDNILKFGKILQDNNITVTIRKEYGGQIDAACGQLRSKEVE
ncbi:MAG: 23S rRNA (adenine(2503)-C(2))-methyltransferase RlmN [Firmicutes bacterium]|nr:23S rRNA (adenine(2503)-C(2))-methyltransferase RlmN [Bacillota bacterium]